MIRLIVTVLGLNLLAACGTATPEWPDRTLRVAVKAPNPCWSIAIEKVYRSGEGVLAVSRLTPPDPGQMCTQVISTVSHEVTLPLPRGPVSYLVLGRTWSWGEPSANHEFLRSRGELEKRLTGAELIQEIGGDEGRKDAGGVVE